MVERGAPARSDSSWLSEGRVLGGEEAGCAVTVGFAASVMTFGKLHHTVSQLSDKCSGQGRGVDAWI